MSTQKKIRRHLAVREDLRRRAQRRLAIALALAERTRMMIARLSRIVDTQSP